MTSIQVPPGLQKAVRLIVTYHEGSSNAVGRDELLRQVRQSVMLVATTDRQLRAAIEELREQGLPICNLLTGDGYYLAGTMDEYQEFRQKYASYAFTILGRVKAMDATVEKLWGSSARQMLLGLSLEEG